MDGFHLLDSFPRYERPIKKNLLIIILQKSSLICVSIETLHRAYHSDLFYDGYQHVFHLKIYTIIMMIIDIGPFYNHKLQVKICYI